MTIIEAINARCKPGMTPLKKDGKYFPGIAGAMNSKKGTHMSNRIKPIPTILPPLYEILSDYDLPHELVEFHVNLQVFLIQENLH